MVPGHAVQQGVAGRHPVVGGRRQVLGVGRHWFVARHGRRGAQVGGDVAFGHPDGGRLWVVATVHVLVGAERADTVGRHVAWLGGRRSEMRGDEMNV